MTTWSLRPNTRAFTAAAITALAVLSACSKPKAEGADPGTTATPEPSSAAATHASASATAAEVASDGAGDAKPAGAEGGTFSGTYTVKPTAMYVPEHKDWASVKWKNEETLHLGDGTVSLTLEPTGRVSGTSEGGALGDAILEGVRDDAGVSGTVRRKDPSDDGLTGTFLATIEGGALVGAMKLANGNAAAVREAPFSLAKAK